MNILLKDKIKNQQNQIDAYLSYIASYYHSLKERGIDNHPLKEVLREGNKRFNTPITNEDNLK